MKRRRPGERTKNAPTGTPTADTPEAAAAPSPPNPRPQTRRQKPIKTTPRPGGGEVRTYPDGTQRDERGRLVAGSTGNMQGRRTGAKTRLTTAVLEKLNSYAEDNLEGLIARVGKEEPAALLKIIVSVVPKELIARMELGTSDGTQVIRVITGIDRSTQEETVADAEYEEVPNEPG